MANSVQERLKLKRITLDTWSTREKLSLASSVQRSGDQNWSCVSRNIKAFAEPNRPVDWFSQKNCAQQYASLLENVETPKRKKRSAGSTDRAEVETPGESIVRKLTEERTAELKRVMAETQAEYLKLLDECNAIANGEADDKIPYYVQELENDKIRKEKEKEAHIRWLREREERRIELERAWRPGLLMTSFRRDSSLSEPSSDADSPLSEPLAVDVSEDSKTNMPAPAPAPTPTSPLLTSLLKSPAGSTPLLPPPNATSILHSAITSPMRGVSPTIASLLNSSGSISPNIKSLVSSTLNAFDDPKPLITSLSQGAPTLSMLLELPPSLPGKPLPVLQIQPPAPPPYSDHLGPPPPYSLATEYLQKQRAEQAAQAAQAQAQIAIQNVEKELMLPTLPSLVSSSLGPDLKDEPVSLDDIEEVIAVDASRSQYGSSDHDYMQAKVDLILPPPVVTAPLPPPLVPVESLPVVVPVPAPVPVTPPPAAPVVAEEVPTSSSSDAKKELDVFEFGEEDDNDAKLTYVRSNAKRLARKEADKMTSPTPMSKDEEEKEEEEEEQEVVAEEVQAEETTVSEDVETPVVEEEPIVEVEQPPAELVVPTETEVKVEEPEKEVVAEDVVTIDVAEGPTTSLLSEDTIKAEVVEVKVEDERKDGAGDSSQGATDVTSTSEVPAVELSTTEDEKSNEPEVSTLTAASVRRRRGTASLSTGGTDSVPNSPVALTEEEKEFKAWKKSVLMTHMQIEGHRSASLFLKPITDDQAPDYSSIIFRPMDLTTIKRNIESGLIRSYAEYQRDIMLMFFNARMYNKTNDVVYQEAVAMQTDSLDNIEVVMEVQGDAAPSRRETRTHDKAASSKPRPSRTSIKPGPGTDLKRKRTSGSTSSDGARKKSHMDES